MSNEDLIITLEMLKAEVEWEFALDYQMALEQVLTMLKEKVNGQSKAED